MSEEEKQLIIELLFNKYKENKDEKILKLIDKVNKSNFIAEQIIMQWATIDSEKNNNETLIDVNELFYKTLDLSNTHLLITNKRIKVLTPEDFLRRRKEKLQ